MMAVLPMAVADAKQVLVVGFTSLDVRSKDVRILVNFVGVVWHEAYSGGVSVLGDDVSLWFD